MTHFVATVLPFIRPLPRLAVRTPVVTQEVIPPYSLEAEMEAFAGGLEAYIDFRLKYPEMFRD